MLKKRFVGVAIAGLTVASLVSVCRATWSIVIVDTRTREVAVGSATCLTNFDLLAITPVVRVGVGGAAVQAAGDFSGIRRPVIRREFLNETSAKKMLARLAQIGGHERRQYGIGLTVGDAVSFTGDLNGTHASGLVGRDGDLVFAIQGNVLTGRRVVRRAERAIIETPGDMAEKLMAAMEAARSMGGDGRCSCDPGAPDRCGAPPPEFEKSAHIGYMILARLGDTDDDQCDSGGCARGDYFMKFNVPFQSNDSPDPVFQLRDMFDQWRLDLIDQPDGVQSDVTIVEGDASFFVTITLKNWQGTDLGSGVQTLTVEHAPGSAGATSIGDVVDHGDGTYSVIVTPNGRSGTDLFKITADDGARPVTLSPYPVLKFPCDVLVASTRAKLKSSGLVSVSSKLTDPDGNPVAGQRVFVKITDDQRDPRIAHLGTSNANGKARGKYDLNTGPHRMIVKTITPPDPGGQCLDLDLPGQDLTSKTVDVP